MDSSLIKTVSEGIVVNGHIGTWYVIDHSIYANKDIYLLEHENYGDEVAAIIVDSELNIIMDDVWNGFYDLPSESFE